MSRRPRASAGLRSRAAATLAVLVLALAGAVIPATSASAAGDVTGRIVDQLEQPVAGVTLQISQRTGGSAVFTPQTGPDGTFQIAGAPDGSYEIYFPEGTVGTGGETFGFVQSYFTVAGSAITVPDVVAARYVTISGTILNWSAAMGDVRATLYYDTGTQWQSVNSNPRAEGTASGSGAFTILAPVFDQEYTLSFIGEGYGTPYVDSFLGGSFDAATATHFTGVAGEAISGIQMTIAAAAPITGRVTSGGVGLPGIEIEVDYPSDDDYDYDYVLTDADGYYTAYVRPGTEYRVYAYGTADHAGMTYDGWDECACNFTPVATSLADPAEDIDFELLERDDSIEVFGIAADDDSVILEDVEVRLFRSSGGEWVLEDVVETDDGVPNFAFLLGRPGTYRLQFVDLGGDILRVIDGATTDADTDSVPLAPVPACYAALGRVVDTFGVVAVLDPATPAGRCVTIEGTAVAPAPSGGTSTPVIARPGSGPPAPTPSATPTATPTPTASATPLPTTSPTPAATEPAAPAPASAPDLWWLFWVALGLVVVVVIGGVVFFVRRP